MAAVDSFETLVPMHQTVQCHFSVYCYMYIDTTGRRQGVMLRFNLNYDSVRYIYYNCSVPDQGVLGPVPPGDRDLTGRHPSGAAVKVEGAGMFAYGQII